MLIRSLGVALIALPALAALPSARGHSSAQQSPITEVTLTATPSSYTGVCPTRIRFTGRIHVTTRLTEFRYEFERSDGTKTPAKLVRGAPRGDVYVVNDRWQVGASGQHLQVWEKLVVSKGDIKVESNQANADITCN